MATEGPKYRAPTGQSLPLGMVVEISSEPEPGTDCSSDGDDSLPSISAIMAGLSASQWAQSSVGRRRIPVSTSESTEGSGVAFATPAASSLADAAPHEPSRPSPSQPSSETVPRQEVDHCSPSEGDIITGATGPNLMNLATTTLCHHKLQDSDVVLSSRRHLADSRGTSEGCLGSAALCVDGGDLNNTTQNTAGVAMTDPNRSALQSDAGLSHPGAHGKDASAIRPGTPTIQTVDARSNGISDGTNVGMHKRRLREHDSGARYSLRPRKGGVQRASGQRHTPDAKTSIKAGQRRAEQGTGNINKPIENKRVAFIYWREQILVKEKLSDLIAAKPPGAMLGRGASSKRPGMLVMHARTVAVTHLWATRILPGVCG
ncbi:hypothetical protein Purlil1_12713 [Purpureocillium lilacinum]|uniref:Uncharacterized protein n=1 Tax=Purpureocillium lilacinum TaxID=33203 RepID=A0ABR0BG21_PURLI|nr:hypothetical protein Purlil1_12713 [Purpureocillium lilacinum]